MSSTRRRIGISVATTEAARRQLMQPVPCWEKVWVAAQDAAPGSTLKVYKWVKTEKKQYFSDDEDEIDEPLAPLPDEPEVNDAEEEVDQDDAPTSVAPEVASRAVSEPLAAPDEAAPSLPKPHPLSMSLVPGSPTPPPDVEEGLGLDDALKPMDVNIANLDASITLDDVDVESTPLQVPPELNVDVDGIAPLDLVDMGPDGTQFEAAGDLSQLQATDSLLGGEVMDESGDPFINIDTTE